MNILRNTIGVLLGLAVSAIIITIGVRINPDWIQYSQIAPFERWRFVLKSVRHKDYFFVALLISSGIAAAMGGVVTALVVKYAKVAYAILIGFILLIAAIADLIIFPYHPTFYKVAIFFVYFPASWIGGKIVQILTRKKQTD